MLILRIFGYHFFIITNYQKIVAKFIILITNRFFPLVSRRQRFFYTVCYKLPSQKMRTRSLCFLLCFCFLVFYFHFFLLLSFLLHGMLQAPVAEDESQLVCFPFLFVFVLFSFSFFLFLYFLSFFSITQFATSSGPRRWGPGSFVFLYTFLVSCFSCLFFYQFSSSPYIWFSSSSLLYFPLLEKSVGEVFSPAGAMPVLWRGQGLSCFSGPFKSLWKGNILINFWPKRKMIIKCNLYDQF